MKLSQGLSSGILRLRDKGINLYTEIMLYAIDLLHILSDQLNDCGKKLEINNQSVGK